MNTLKPKHYFVTYFFKANTPKTVIIQTVIKQDCKNTVFLKNHTIRKTHTNILELVQTLQLLNDISSF